jgi:hypothetical protein
VGDGLASTHSGLPSWEDPHDDGIRAGLLSQCFGRFSGTCDVSSAPGVVTFSGGWGGNPLEDVKRTGQQLAGDGHGGDLLAPAGRALGVEPGERGAGLGLLSGLLQHPPHPRRALLGDVAVADLAVGVAHRGGEPAPGAQLAGGREATDVADLGDQVMAVIGPIPGRACSAWTRGSGLARASRSRSSLATSGVIASIRPQQSSTMVRWTAGRARSASQARPAVVHSRSVSWTPRSASTACTRHLAAVTMRPSHARCRSRARWSRTCWGAIQASGSRSARSSWARVWASTLSFFRRPRRSPCSGWDGPGGVPAQGPQAGRPASPSRRRPRTRPACPTRARRGSTPVGRVVGQVAVGELDAMLVHQRHLGALAVDVHADVDTHQGLLP